MSDTFTSLNDLEDVRAVARSIHAVAAIRRLACRAVADGEISGPQPTAFAGTLAALDDLLMGLAEDVQATAGEVYDRLKAERDTARVLGVAPVQAVNTAAPASDVLEAARKVAAQRLPTSDGIIAAAREAVAQQLDGRAAG